MTRADHVFTLSHPFAGVVTMDRTKPIFPELANMLKSALGDMLDQKAQDFVELFAEDGVIEFPYTLPDWPKRVSGHADLAAYLEPISEMFSVEAVTGLTVHRSQDPEVAIVEYSISGHAVKTGRHYNQSYVEVLTIQNGKIKTYRDYWNPLVVQNLNG